MTVCFHPPSFLLFSSLTLLFDGPTHLPHHDPPSSGCRQSDMGSCSCVSFLFLFICPPSSSSLFPLWCSFPVSTPSPPHEFFLFAEFSSIQSNHKSDVNNRHETTFKTHPYMCSSNSLQRPLSVTLNHPGSEPNWFFEPLISNMCFSLTILRKEMKFNVWTWCVNSGYC